MGRVRGSNEVGMKYVVEAVLIVTTLVFTAYVGQFVLARDCGEHGQFRFGDLIYRCEVARWAQ